MPAAGTADPMSYQKKVYRSMICAPGCPTTQQDGRRTTSGGSHQSRGGTSPKATDTRFGALGNQHRTKHAYPQIPVKKLEKRKP